MRLIIRLRIFVRIVYIDSEDLEVCVSAMAKPAATKAVLVEGATCLFRGDVGKK